MAVAHKALPNLAPDPWSHLLLVCPGLLAPASLGPFHKRGRLAPALGQAFALVPLA